MFYRFARAVVRVVCAPFFWRKVIGRENIPKTGGVILALNHRSNWDVVIAGLSCPRPLNFMAKKELFENKMLGWLIRHLNAFPLARGTGDIKAVKTAMGRLKAGEVLQLFPEGTRVKDGSDVDAKAGVAMFATRAKVPVVPGVIVGDYRAFHRITVVFGKPIYLEEYYGQKLEMQQLHKISDGILEQIRQMNLDVKRCIAGEETQGLAYIENKWT